MDTMGEAMRETLERLRPSEDSFLPAAAVELQRWLALFSRDDLQHLLIGGAVQLASRDALTVSPDEVVTALLPHARQLSGEGWGKLADEVVRLSNAARVAAEPPADDDAGAGDEAASPR